MPCALETSVQAEVPPVSNVSKGMFLACSSLHLPTWCLCLAACLIEPLFCVCRRGPSALVLEEQGDGRRGPSALVLEEQGDGAMVDAGGGG